MNYFRLYPHQHKQKRLHDISICLRIGSANPEKRNATFYPAAANSFSLLVSAGRLSQHSTSSQSAPPSGSTHTHTHTHTCARAHTCTHARTNTLEVLWTQQPHSCFDVFLAILSFSFAFLPFLFRPSHFPSLFHLFCIFLLFVSFLISLSVLLSYPYFLLSPSVSSSFRIVVLSFTPTSFSSVPSIFLSPYLPTYLLSVCLAG
jgi:hypothetical protein